MTCWMWLLEAGNSPDHALLCNIADPIKYRIQSYNTLAQENHLSLESKVADGLPLVAVDENKIGQVLNNLLSNAIKFTQTGKIITSAFIFGVENRSLLKPQVSV